MQACALICKCEFQSGVLKSQLLSDNDDDDGAKIFFYKSPHKSIYFPEVIPVFKSLLSHQFEIEWVSNSRGNVNVSTL